jgi:hypothetical protein
MKTQSQAIPTEPTALQDRKLRIGSEAMSHPRDTTSPRSFSKSKEYENNRK